MSKYLLILLLGFFSAEVFAKVTACSPEKMHEIVSEPSHEGDHSVEIDCSVDLSSNVIITKRVVFSGSDASDVTFSCNGAILRPNLKGNGVRILSEFKDGKWLRPENIVIKGCRIETGVYISGMAGVDEGKIFQMSSFQEGHTQRAQNAAPKKIVFQGNVFAASGFIPVYVSNGATKINIENNKFIGKSRSVAIYLDAESGFNKIHKNDFNVDSAARELIAIDGSAYNIISENNFQLLNNGGIYLYRNCGERGVVRQQTPSYNTISGNNFIYSPKSGRKPAIWIASRKGKSSFCALDRGHGIGSSIDDRDWSQYNNVYGNIFINPLISNPIKVDFSPNNIGSNEIRRE